MGLQSHLYDYSLLYPGGHADTQYILSDLKKCGNSIKKVIPHFKTRIMRFQGGSFSWNGSGETIKALNEINLFHVDWSIMTGDADPDYKDKTPEGTLKYVDNIYRKLPYTDFLILLMHGPSYMDSTPESLQKVTDYFKDKGYSFGIIV